MKIEKISHGKYRWINISGPDEGIADFLRSEFKAHPLMIEDVLSKSEYPKIDAFDEYLFAILQFPIFNPEKKMYNRTELDILLGRDYIVTINSGKLQPLQQFFERTRTQPKLREKYMGDGVARLFYEIVDSLFDQVFPFVQQKYDVIFRLEEDIFESIELHDAIQDIMILKRDLINIRRIIVPQRDVIHDIELKYKKFIPEELDIYFNDIVDKIDKITNQLETATKYVDVLQDANETIITRNTNRVIKILTIFSVTLLPLTLVTGYYGMNLALPLQNHPNGIYFINGLMLILLFLMLGFFFRKRWLS